MYNGYKNYETWLIASFLKNDEPTYLYYQTVVDEMKQKTAPEELADQLKARFHDDFGDAIKETRISLAVPALPCGVFSEAARDIYKYLLSAAYENADFEEVARSFLYV